MSAEFILKRLEEVGFIDIKFIMDGSTVNAKDFIENLVWENEELMEELAYYALQKPNFASRVNERAKPDMEPPEDDR